MKPIWTFFFLCVCALSVAAQTEAGKPSSGMGPGKSENLSENADLKILSKPNAPYPTGTVCVQGTVRLKVEFLKTGKIGKIIPVTRLPHGLTESAIKAAGEIRFRPKRVAGESVTVVDTVVYTFSIY